MGALLRAAHIGPTVAVTAIATTLAASAGRGAGSVLVAAAVLAGQLSVGWSNDFVDRHRDAAAGRTEKPIVAGAVRARTVGTGAVLAAVACVPLSMLSGWRAGLVHCGAVAVAWAYNLGIKATALSPLPYALAFGSMPTFVSLGLRDPVAPPAWATAAAALLGTGAHFVNTLPDQDADRLTGVRGLPQRIGPTASTRVAAVLLCAAAASVVLASPGDPGPLALGMLAVTFAGVAYVVVAAGSGRPRRAWTATLCTAGTSVGLFLAAGGDLAGR